MKTIHFYVDFISPYAWLGFDALPRALEGISHRVVHKPVLFAGLLKHHGQLGPAEIPTKRDWTYRQVLWLALALRSPTSALEQARDQQVVAVALAGVVLGEAVRSGRGLVVV